MIHNHACFTYISPAAAPRTPHNIDKPSQPTENIYMYFLNLIQINLAKTLMYQEFLTFRIPRAYRHQGPIQNRKLQLF